MIINGENTVLGRLASFAAKQALLGEDVIIINCTKIMISGTKKQVLAKFNKKVAMGTPHTGPYLHRSAEKLAKRTIRNMLPYKQGKGSDALKRIMCYNKVPAGVDEAQAIKLEKAQITKLPNLKYVSLGVISKLIGGKE